MKGVFGLIFELTIQVRVRDFDKGLHWYQLLLNKKPDFIPHDGFAEWELVPGSWLQLAEGEPADGSGPLRLGVTNLEEYIGKLKDELGVKEVSVHTRPEVPVKWCPFSDPWGNLLGLFEYID